MYSYIAILFSVARWSPRLIIVVYPGHNDTITLSVNTKQMKNKIYKRNGFQNPQQVIYTRVCTHCSNPPAAKRPSSGRVVHWRRAISKIRGPTINLHFTTTTNQSPTPIQSRPLPRVTTPPSMCRSILSSLRACRQRLTLHTPTQVIVRALAHFRTVARPPYPNNLRFPAKRSASDIGLQFSATMESRPRRGKLPSRSVPLRSVNLQTPTDRPPCAIVQFHPADDTDREACRAGLGLSGSSRD